MKFSFSHRIIGGFLLMAVLSVLVGFVAYRTTRDLQRVSQAIMKENVTSLKAAEELELALLNQKGLVSSYFLDGNPAWLETLEAKKKDFELWFKNAQEVALTLEEKRILKEIRILYQDYDRQRNRAVRFYQSGNFTEAKKVLLNEMKNSIDALYQRCEDLILANEALIAKAELASGKRVLRMTYLIWTMIVIASGLGLLMGFWIARRINTQFIQSAKLASLGQLSATIAHEVRNPLAAIKMRLYSLQEGFKDQPSSTEDLAVISEEINRMDRIVQNFLDFARPPAPNFQRCDIHQVLEGILQLMTPKAISQKIVIERHFQEDSPKLKVDPQQMRQAFLNILLNAIEAMPQGGILTLSTLCKNHDKKLGHRLQIAFKDSGEGIPPDLKKRLFEPFLTTKTGGTGLGLFIARRIIQTHQGEIYVESEAGNGTLLKVSLPIHE